MKFDFLSTKGQSTGGLVCAMWVQPVNVAKVEIAATSNCWTQRFTKAPFALTCSLYRCWSTQVRCV